MDQKTISITKLCKISKKLAPKYLPNSDIYSLLVLSLMTVTTYSRKYHHLSTTTRLELSYDFLPDLITCLISNKYLDFDVAKTLTDEISSKKGEIGNILQSYIYIADGLSIKKKDNNKDKCVLI